MRSIVFIYLIMICFFISCNDSRNLEDQSKVEHHIPSDYQELFQIMKNSFIDRYTIDWNTFKKKGN